MFRQLARFQETEVDDELAGPDHGVRRAERVAGGDDSPGVAEEIVTVNGEV